MVPLVIANPRCAGGRAGRTIEAVRGVIERRLGRVDLVLTERCGHAIALAANAVRDGRSLVIAVGGDGTLHEVANGVLDMGGGAAVGYVGQGTGGDFRRTLGLDHRLDVYVEAIAQGGERSIDVGRVRYRCHEGPVRSRWFINVLSAGLGGLVDRHVMATTKAFGGKAAYFLATLRALAEGKRGRLRCASSLVGVQAQRDLDAYMLAICNGKYFGAGMLVAPMAEPDDARFEVVSMDAPSRVAFAGFSRQVYGGRHIGLPGVSHFACDRLTLDLLNDSARSAFLLDVDGEPLGGLPIEVEVVPKALRLRA
jgi:YegS/Rv2252/BmrU family lipid kinase